MTIKNPAVPLVLIIATLLTSGCVGDARIHLAAADSMDLIRDAMTDALAEYHADLAALDAQRRDAAVDAFIARLRTDVADDQAADAEAEAFRRAVTRLDTDREVAWQRYAASLDTVALLGEIASDLRRLAADSMSLDDEAKRYFTDLVQKQKDRKLQATVAAATALGAGGLGVTGSLPAGASPWHRFSSGVLANPRPQPERN